MVFPLDLSEMVVGGWCGWCGWCGSAHVLLSAPLLSQARLETYSVLPASQSTVQYSTCLSSTRADFKMTRSGCGRAFGGGSASWAAWSSARVRAPYRRLTQAGTRKKVQHQ